MAHHASIVPIEECRGAVLLGIVKRHPLGKMGVRSGDCPRTKQCHSQGTMRRQQHGSIVDLMG
jgi:hypothetical protein